MTTPTLLSPRVVPDSIAAALETANREREPVLYPVQVFADDRGWSIMNQFLGVLSPQGQVNYSVQYPGVVKAWHRHTLQTDLWLCTLGNLKAGVFDESTGRTWLAVLGEKRPAVLVIPRPLWHGAAAVGDAPAGLLYYVTHAFNPAKPDEQRRAHDSVPGFPWGVRHG